MTASPPATPAVTSGTSDAAADLEDAAHLADMVLIAVRLVNEAPELASKPLKRMGENLKAVATGAIYRQFWSLYGAVASRPDGPTILNQILFLDGLKRMTAPDIVWDGWEAQKALIDQLIGDYGAPNRGIGDLYVAAAGLEYGGQKLVETPFALAELLQFALGRILRDDLPLKRTVQR